jgi:hypothetical protein
MDKKRLRVMYASVAGVFSTVVPLLLAFNSDSQNAMHYGSFSTHPAVYAFNAESRGYEDSVKFCESLWMDIAVFHSMEELLDGMLSLTHGVDSFVGATRAPAPDGGAPNSFAWVDGTPWWQPEEDIIDWHSAQDPYIYVMNPVEGQSTVFDATFAVRKCAVLCKARDVGAIRGAMPPVMNLGALPAHAVPPPPQHGGGATCAMTEGQLGLVQGVAAGFNSSCTYRTEVGPGVARMLP